MKNRNAIIAANIKKYLKEKNVTQKELAISIGISPSTLSDYMNLRSNPSHGVIQKIADYFNVVKSDIDTTYKTESKIQIIFDKLTVQRQDKVYRFAERQLYEQEHHKNIIHMDEVRELFEQYQTKEDFEDVDIYGAVSAGTGVEIYEDVVETVSYPSPVPAHDIALRVYGDSMSPLYKHGDIIFVDKTHEINHGQIGVFILNGQGFLKKFYKDYDSVKLVSVNKNYGDIILTEDDRVDLVGTVIL